MPTDPRPRRFPDGFLFGTKTSAYQVEGSVDADGRGVSIWDTFSHTPGITRHGDTGDVTADHYRRLDQDLDLIARAGRSAGTASRWPGPASSPWAAGPPTSPASTSTAASSTGCAGGASMPVLTLFHWDLPQALEDAGGWAARDTAGRFADYAAIVAGALGAEVGMWVTHNEPWCAVVARLRHGRARARAPRPAAGRRRQPPPPARSRPGGPGDPGGGPRRPGRHRPQPPAGAPGQRPRGRPRRRPARRRQPEPALPRPGAARRVPGRHARPLRGPPAGVRRRARTATSR